MMMVLDMLISEQSILSLSATRLYAAWNNGDQKEYASEYDSCNLPTIKPRVCVIAILTTIIVVVANISLKFRLVRLLNLSICKFPSSGTDWSFSSCYQSHAAQ